MQLIDTLYSYTPINPATSNNGWLTGIPALDVLTFSGINALSQLAPSLS